MAFPTVTVTPGSGQTVNTLPNAGQATSANSLPVVIASDQSALAVTGAFYQTTQPVSGTVTANISGTVPVTGTFYQATQPISAASLPLPAGAATQTTLLAISGQIPASLGRQTASASLSIVTAGKIITNYSISGGSVTGSSQTAVSAGQATGYLNILNPAVNTGTIYVDPSGGTASSTNGIPLIPGAQFELTGGVANAVTFIGTATQPIQIWGGV